MRPQSRSRLGQRLVPVVDRSGARVARPTIGQAPGAPSDRRIHVVNATPPAMDALDEAKFKRLSRQEQITAAITAHVEHVRKQNNPEVLQRLSETEFWRYVLDESLRNAQLVDGGSDPRIVLRSASLRELRTAWQAVRHLVPKTTGVVTQPKMPNRDPWWSFVKDFRLRTRE